MRKGVGPVRDLTQVPLADDSGGTRRMPYKARDAIVSHTLAQISKSRAKAPTYVGDVTPFVGPGLMRVGGCSHAATPC